MSIEKDFKQVNEGGFKAKGIPGLSNVTRFAQSTTQAAVLALGLMLAPAVHAEEAQNTTAESVSDYSTVNTSTDGDLDNLSGEFDKYVHLESDSDIPVVDKELFFKDSGINLDDEENVRNALNLNTSEYKEFKVNVLKAGISWEFILISVIILFLLGQEWFRGILASIRDGAVNSFNFLNGLRTSIHQSPHRNAIYAAILLVFTGLAGYHYLGDSEEDKQTSEIEQVMEKEKEREKRIEDARRRRPETKKPETKEPETKEPDEPYVNDSDWE